MFACKSPDYSILFTFDYVENAFRSLVSLWVIRLGVGLGPRIAAFQAVCPEWPRMR